MRGEFPVFEARFGSRTVIEKKLRDIDSPLACHQEKSRPPTGIARVDRSTTLDEHADNVIVLGNSRNYQRRRPVTPTPIDIRPLLKKLPYPRPVSCRSGFE